MQLPLVTQKSLIVFAKTVKRERKVEVLREIRNRTEKTVQPTKIFEFSSVRIMEIF